jgi:hypothetical protein
MMLSKSDFMKYKQCPCALWLQKCRPDLLPPIDTGLQHVFDMGNQVDREAHTLFPGGHHVEGFVFDGWRNTQKAFAEGHEVLFQPTAVAGELHARADILTRNRSLAGWDIREVKMTTRVKEEHITDLAFQLICFRDARVDVAKTYLVHINGRYVRRGAINPKKLFAQEDVTEEVRKEVLRVRREIPKALAILKWGNKPTQKNVDACVDSESCEYLGYYLKELPNPIRQELMDERAETPRPNPPVITVDTDRIQRALSGIHQPMQFLDYETYSPAIPMFDGYRPYEAVTFQYSLHTQQKYGGKTSHVAYLHDKLSDPAPELAAHLQKHALPGGTFVAWYATFEKTRNDEMARRLPSFELFFASVNRRMFDPINLFKRKGGAYFHSDFGGSASLKKVLPVIVPELSYGDLAIQKGDVASYSWPVLIDPTVPAEKRKKLREDMLEYCSRDTLAMVKIVEHLDEVARKGQKRLV